MSGDTTSESEIRRLLAKYCQLIDDGNFDDWIQLFTDDIEFVVMGMHKHGHAELRGFIEPSQQADARGKHMISEPWIEVDGDIATATTDFAWVSKQGSIGQSGRYHDRIVRQPDGWRFERREIVFTGEKPE
ncbi:MAG: 3-phenylpropionate/cinnamic acid dioxygenase small subunit [Candidatus Aldehydirespiratoraceae bacterium]